MRAQALVRARADADEEAVRRSAAAGSATCDDLRDYCVSIEVPHMQRAQFRERV